MPRFICLQIYLSLFNDISLRFIKTIDLILFI